MWIQSSHKAQRLTKTGVIIPWQTEWLSNFQFYSKDLEQIVIFNFLIIKFLKFRKNNNLHKTPKVQMRNVYIVTILLSINLFARSFFVLFWIRVNLNLNLWWSFYMWENVSWMVSIIKKNCAYDLEDKEHSGSARKFKDADLDALLKEDSYQTQQKHPDSLKSDPVSYISSFKINELKSKDTGCRTNWSHAMWNVVSFHTRTAPPTTKKILHYLVTDDGSTTIQSEKSREDSRTTRQHRLPSRTSIDRSWCVFGATSLASYIMNHSSRWNHYRNSLQNTLILGSLYFRYGVHNLRER